MRLAGHGQARGSTTDAGRASLCATWRPPPFTRASYGMSCGPDLSRRSRPEVGAPPVMAWVRPCGHKVGSLLDRSEEVSYDRGLAPGPIAVVAKDPRRARRLREASLRADPAGLAVVCRYHPTPARRDGNA